MPLYHPIMYRSSSYGSRDPCPDGMSMTTALIETLVYNVASDSNVLKNITYLICDESSGKGVDLGLALGLGLGLGIPVIALLSCLCYGMCIGDCIESRRRTARIRNTIENIGKSVSPETPLKKEINTELIQPIKMMDLTDILVPERHHHFAMDILDEQLKNDINNLSNEQLVKLLKLAVNKYSLRNYIADVLHKRDYGVEIV